MLCIARLTAFTLLRRTRSPMSRATFCSLCSSYPRPSLLGQKRRSDHCRPLPAYPDQRTSPDRPSWSVSCQQETRLIGALHAPFKINRWSGWLACPRTIETPESVEPRRHLEPPPSHSTYLSIDEVSAPLTCLREKRGRAFHHHRSILGAFDCRRGNA
jgi:hypothetical protein